MKSRSSEPGFLPCRTHEGEAISTISPDFRTRLPAFFKTFLLSGLGTHSLGHGAVKWLKGSNQRAAISDFLSSWGHLSSGVHSEGLVMDQSSPEGDGSESKFNEFADNTNLSSCVHLHGRNGFQWPWLSRAGSERHSRSQDARPRHSGQTLCEGREA